MLRSGNETPTRCWPKATLTTCRRHGPQSYGFIVCQPTAKKLNHQGLPRQRTIALNKCVVFSIGLVEHRHELIAQWRPYQHRYW